MATATRLTAEQYYSITVEGDGKQLVDGEIVVNEPRFPHWLLHSRVISALDAWIRAGDGRGVAGPAIDIRVDDHNVFGPDVVWFADERPPLNHRGYPAAVPDLCVEIRSPSTWRYDIGAKKRAYEEGGLPELWLVDGEASSVLVYRRSTPDVQTFDVTRELAGEEMLTSPQLPEFELPLDDIFAE